MRPGHGLYSVVHSVRQAFSVPSSQDLRDSTGRALAVPSTPAEVPQTQSGDTPAIASVQESLSQGQQWQLESRMTELDATIQNLRNSAASTEKDRDGQAMWSETAAQKTRRFREERNEALVELEEAKAEVAALKGRILTISDANESYTELNEELNQIVESLREQNTQQAQDTNLVDALLERIQSINTAAHKVDEAHRELFRENERLRQSEIGLKRKLASSETLKSSLESQLASSELRSTNQSDLANGLQERVRELEKQLKSANKRVRRSHDSNEGLQALADELRGQVSILRREKESLSAVLEKVREQLQDDHRQIQALLSDWDASAEKQNTSAATKSA
ncbi:hypothetical protein F4680DRAFT_210240 [Xylaria scruposa]|nr:hypothetical protein F4680DRAFT_210240 [Xylaria scruposa]